MRVADTLEATRLHCARLFQDPFDVPYDPVAELTATLSDKLHVSQDAASALVHRITVSVQVHSSDSAAATTMLPRTACALLRGREGYVWNEHDVWNAQAVRDGKIDKMFYWPFPSVEQELAACDAVFIGKVTAKLAVASATGPAEFQVTVEDLLRGTLAPSVTVIIPRAFPMAVGKRYLLFVTRTARGFSVDPRGHSDPLADATATIETVRMQARTAERPTPKFSAV